MNVIFLDIDGVMVTSNHLVKSPHHISMEFDPKCVANLKKILDACPDVRLIISSTWRIGFTVSQLRDIFNVYGITGRIWTKTPHLGHEAIRGEEIAQLLADFSNLTSSNKIDKFVIIDDDADMGELIDHLVQCPPYQGLTDEVAERVIELLR